MEVGSAFSSGLAGIHTGMQGLQQNAFDIARAPVAQQKGEDDKVVEALMESKQNVTQVEASIKVVEAAAGNIGTLLDITV